MKWEGACSGTTATCTVRMDAAKTVTAKFTQALTLNMAGTGNGQFTKTIDGVTTPATTPITYIESGKAVIITAIPGAESAFSGWSGDCQGSAPTCNLAMNGDKSTTANFTQNQFGLTINIQGTGTVTKTPNLATYPINTQVTLRAVGGSGSAFSSWGTGPCASSSSETCTFAMDSAKTQNVIFVPTFNLTLGKEGRGAATVQVAQDPAGNFNPESKAWGFLDNSQVTYTRPAGSVMIIKAAVTLPSIFINWSGACSGSDPLSCRVTLDAAKAVTAQSFTWQNQTMKEDVNNDGTIDINDYNVLLAELNSRGSRRLGASDTALPFIDTNGDGNVSPLDILTVVNWLNANRKTLTLQQTTGGSLAISSVWPSSEASATNGYAIGTKVTVVANPSNGFSFGSWTAPGDCLLIRANTCQITITTDTRAMASFTPNRYNLSLNKSGNGSFEKTVNNSPTTAESFEYQTIVKITAKPDPGYLFSSWTGDCASQGQACIVTMNGNKTATANFQITRFPLSFQQSTAGSINITAWNPNTERGQVTFASGTRITVTAVPTPGYKFGSWTGPIDCVNNSSTSCTIIMDAEKIVSARWEIAPVLAATAAGIQPDASVRTNQWQDFIPRGWKNIGQFVNCHIAQCNGIRGFNAQFMSVTPVAGGTAVMTDLQVIGNGRHINGGPACPAGYTSIARVEDAGGTGIPNGHVNFCAKYESPVPGGTYVSEIWQSPWGAHHRLPTGCPAGSGMTPAGYVADCSTRYPCFGNITICQKKGTFPATPTYNLSRPTPLMAP